MALAVVLAACGGGGDTGDVQADRAGSTEDTTAVVGSDTDDGTTDAGGGDASGDDADAPAAAPSAGGDGTDDAPAATPGGDGGEGSGATPTTAAAPAAGTPATLDDQGALARVLRVGDLPAGYQKREETVGEDEEGDDFEESFRKCMKAGGADPAAITEPTGQAGRVFGKGQGSPQDPTGINAGVIGVADAATAARMVSELRTLFTSEPGRVCIEKELQEAIAEETATVAPGATVVVDAQQLTTYKAAGGVAQLRLVITVTLGTQQFEFVSDLVVMSAGNAVGLVAFTEAEKAFDPAVAQPIVDKALARLAG